MYLYIILYSFSVSCVTVLINIIICVLSYSMPVFLILLEAAWQARSHCLFCALMSRTLCETTGLCGEEARVLPDMYAAQTKNTWTS